MRFVLFYILICASVSIAAAAVIYPIMAPHQDTPLRAEARPATPAPETRVIAKTSRLPACEDCLDGLFPADLGDRLDPPGPTSSSLPLLPLPPMPKIGLERNAL